MDKEYQKRFNYRDGQGENRCENCAWSRRRLTFTTCDLVRQSVNPNAVCDLLTIQTPKRNDRA